MSNDGLAQQIEELVAGISQRADDPGYRGPAVPTGDEIVDELIYSFMHWEAGGEHARGAMERFGGTFVDANELRVCHPSEIASVLGVRFPKGLERAERLAAALRGIYDRENVLALQTLREKSKRDARAYLESLAGVPRFVAARIVLLRLEGHAFPLDRRLMAMLKAEGVAVGTTNPDQACGPIERAVRAVNARDVYLALEHHCQSMAQTKPGGQAGTRRAASGT